MKLKTLISCFHSFFSFNSCIRNCVIEMPQRTLSLDMDIYFLPYCSYKNCLPSFSTGAVTGVITVCYFSLPWVTMSHTSLDLCTGVICPRNPTSHGNSLDITKDLFNSKFEQDLLKTTHFPFICWS